MEYRGPILLVFGLSLIMSPLAIRSLESTQNGAEPGRIVTEGQAAADCAARSVKTPSGRLGCQTPSNDGVVARVMEGGATFVAARN